MRPLQMRDAVNEEMLPENDVRVEFVLDTMLSMYLDNDAIVKSTNQLKQLGIQLGLGAKQVCYLIEQVTRKIAFQANVDQQLIQWLQNDPKVVDNIICA